jgi:molybdopterin-guanine dinucleotide biosynthesis protein A
VLEQAGLHVLVIANDPDVAKAVGTEARGDIRLDRGPLAGIETGLTEARARGLEGILVIACDLVLVDAPLLAELVQVWPGSGAAAYLADGPWGVAPLCSVWGGDLLPAVSDALDEGRGSPGEMLLEIPLVRTAPSSEYDPGRLFSSANRPDDLVELEAWWSEP